jgi:hypothetical protein
MVKLTDSVLKSLNQKMHFSGIFCDLTKAFYSVNHEMLLSKLHYFGIRGAMANKLVQIPPYRKKEKQKIEIKLHYATQSTYSSC